MPDFDGHVARASAVVILAIRFRPGLPHRRSQHGGTQVLLGESETDRKNFPRGADSFPAIAIVTKPLFRVAESRSRFGHLSVWGFAFGNGGPLARRVFPVAFVF